MISSVLSTALTILVAAILIIWILFIIFTIFPFRYIFTVKYNDYMVYVKFDYLIFSFLFYLSLRHGLKYKVVIMNRIIADSEKKNENVKKDNEKNSSIGNTEFIENKDIEEHAKSNDKLIKKLFMDAKKRHNDNIKNVDGDSDKRIFSIIDNFKYILPENTIEVAKLVVKEFLAFYIVIKPKKVSINIDAGFDDPYMTGIMLVAATPLYAMLGDDLDFTPHFNKNIFSAKLVASARPMLLFMMFPVIRLLANKKFRDIVFSGRRYKKHLVKVTR